MKMHATLGLALAAALLAGCGSDDAPAATAAEGGGSEVTIASGDLWYEPEAVTVAAGTVTFTLDNSEGAVEHDLVIEELGDLEVAYAAPGETVTGDADLEAGTYTFYCSIPGHRSQMEGSLTVE